MKAYTTVKQSKFLAKILPLESADMRYSPLGDKMHPWVWTDTFIEKDAIPCWSLAALLEIIPRNLKIVLAVNDYWDGNAVKYKYAIGSVEHNNYDCYADNHVDACYELIIKLHEQNLL